MYGGPPPPGPWQRPGQGYGGSMSPNGPATNSPGPSNGPNGPYAGPPPPSNYPGQHPHAPPPGPSGQMHYMQNSSPGYPPFSGSPQPPAHTPSSASFQQGPPPGFVQGRPPASGYAGPPPAHYAGPPPPAGPASMMPQQGPYDGPPPGMSGYGGPGAPMGPTAALPIGGVPAHTTLFVGSISAGVTDFWLKKLFDACGALRSFKRVTTFGFAEFIDAESVLRALAVLPGLELPAQGKDADNPTSRKKLTVKADEKTRKYLDQYEQGRMQTQAANDFEEAARKTLNAIVQQMADPNNTEDAEAADTNHSIPSHLRDLPPEELAEEHRGAVLSEIEKFRQASAARDEERRRKERIQEMERMRASDRAQHSQRGPSDASGLSTTAQAGGRRSHADPQSYSRPVNFVPESAGQREDENALQPDERDAREEERRLQYERDEATRAAQEAERRYQSQERSRLAHWDRELGKEESENEQRRRAAASQRRHYEEWDQSRECERDLFYVDRARWRAQRRQQRKHEEKEDEVDRQAQAEEEEKARIETERFLAQQAEDMAAFEREQRAAGVLMPTAAGEHAPLKLKRVAAADGGEANAPPNTLQPAAAQSASTGQTKSILGTLEDDSDLSGIRRGKLGHIDLTDTSDVEALRERVRRDLPAARDALFDKQPNWEKMPKDAIDTRYRENLDKGMIASLGESVPDMVEELLSKVRAHVSAAELVDIVEPVLEDEAAPLIANLWIEILVDTLAGPPQ